MARPRNVEIDCKAFLISDNIRYATINCSISFLDNEKKELITEKTGHFSRKYVEEYEFFKSLLKDQLTIFCEISVVIEQTELLCPSPVWDESYLHRNVNQNIEKFQGSQFLTDVDLEVSGKTFKGHKLILAAVSPVFEKMFQGKSQENQNNRVIIKDVRADVFEELMTYIYSGQLPHLKEMSSELLEVADRYWILPLLQICMNDVLENMSVEDAAATYVLADRHSLHQVKPVIIHFMKKHFYEVATSAGWLSLGNHHPQLAKEIGDKILEKTV
jgi:kelch-like protein 20/kelch repeat/BTB domain-containing protein 2